ncbi:helix-turn-helix domain-containing protein [Pseudoflavonifractor capillosus]|uniref:AraC family transcriptional regulator n=1 Tax=Pseudoflavonifractor capillosus TaxID=106588 RepID=A0A921MPC3_9FIRM|nr:helix-turn-helix domain-containing protein [Pseudoflavonifractor capillosus]HJG87589.1 AraC family transcriptional regulator [Pseudoflavonifractor capillosus]
MTDSAPLPILSAASPLISNAVIQNMPANFYFNTHIHRTVELLICLSGAVSITIQGQSHLISEKQYIVIFPNFPHDASVVGDKPCKILQTHFYGHALSALIEQYLPISEMSFFLEFSLKKKSFFLGESTPQLADCLEGLRSEFLSDRKLRQEMIALYLSQISILLSRDMASHTSSSYSYKNRYLLAAITYINSNYMKRLSVGEIASNAAISPRYLTKLFHEQLNIGISAYITHIRISNAIELKYENPHYLLTDLALDVGFGSLQHFSKAFKETMGVSPKRFFSIHISD